MSDKDIEAGYWEQELYYVVTGNGGGFLTKLFEAACHADGKNQERLKKGFPEFITAIQRYQSEPGYWESLVERIK